MIALPTHEELYLQSRVSSWLGFVSRPKVEAWYFLILMGICSGISVALLNVSLRVPGHAILRAVFPMAFGLALVPRRGGGTVMGASALATILIGRPVWELFRGTGDSPGLGATTSLALTGPLLDLALWQARSGWRLYVGVIAAAAGSNFAAFLVRLSWKIWTAGGLGTGGGGGGGGGGGTGRRALAEWWPTASVSYLACGIVAGLISAGFWFHFSPQRRSEPDS